MSIKKDRIPGDIAKIVKRAGRMKPSTVDLLTDCGPTLFRLQFKSLNDKCTFLKADVFGEHTDQNQLIFGHIDSKRNTFTPVSLNMTFPYNVSIKIDGVVFKPRRLEHRRFTWLPAIIIQPEKFWVDPDNNQEIIPK